jgi:hypothetical protein
MRGYPNYRNEILTDLTQRAKANNLNGTRIFRALVESWIAAGCPSRFEINKIVHAQPVSSKDRFLHPIRW